MTSAVELWSCARLDFFDSFLMLSHVTRISQEILPWIDYGTFPGSLLLVASFSFYF